MLKELLVTIKDTGYVSVSALAGQLGHPVGLIEDGLAKLITLGYLQEDASEGECQTSCAKCPFANLCQGIPLKTMTITEKGESVLR